MNIRTMSTFEYRGFECEVKHLGWDEQMIGGFLREGWVNGYMRGPMTVVSYDEADTVADVHGGFTYFEAHDDGTSTLGFDTAHYSDGPQTRNEAYVTSEIKCAIDGLYAAGVVRQDVAR
jgi:hypothetical protein